MNNWILTTKLISLNYLYLLSFHNRYSLPKLYVEQQFDYLELKTNLWLWESSERDFHYDVGIFFVRRHVLESNW